MTIDIAHLTIVALSWSVYFALHSLLASLRFKQGVARRWPHVMPYYRLAFNAVALVSLPIPLWLMYGTPGPLLWSLSGPARWAADGVALLAVMGFFWTLRDYDGTEFLGLRQWRRQIRAVEDQERFRLSPLHRVVRHPWYFLGLVILWTRPMDAALLVSAVVITVYLYIGSALEERKLERYHGERYRRYRRRVPRLLPSPRRWLTRAQVDALLGPDGSRDSP